MEHFAKLAQKVDLNASMVMVEFPKMLHAGFYNCLERLQRMDRFAFQNCLAPSLSSEQLELVLKRTLLDGHPPLLRSSPPSYALQPGFAYNLMSVGKIKNDESLRDLAATQLEMGASIDHLVSNTIFDQGQAAALQHCLLTDFAFVQGPPGTGKTFLGIHLTRVLLASRRSTKPILVVCLTNHALDSFLGGLKDAGVDKLLRIGGGSKEEWTEAINLNALNRKTRFSPREMHKTFAFKEDQWEAFASIREWCEAQSLWTSSGKASWYAIKDIVASDCPDLFSQFETISDTSYLRIDIYEFWAGGGDICKVRLLNSSMSTANAGTKRIPPFEEDKNEIFNDLCNRTERQHTRLGRGSIWLIPSLERRKLVEEWEAKVDFDALLRDLSTSFIRHRDCLESIRNIKNVRNVRTVLNYDVIGITTTGCAGRWNLLNKLDLEIVICEEAGEVMEAHALCALLPTIQHAIFIGDPLQLRPEVQQRPMSLECSSDYRLDESLFERMVMPQDPACYAAPTEHLIIQRRMHREIADITRLTYPYLRDEASRNSDTPVAGLDQRLFWWDHRVPELGDTGVSKSHINQHEVKMVQGLVGYLIKTNTYSPGDIAILTPYAGQLAALHESLGSTCKLWLSEKDRSLLLDEELIDLDRLAPRQMDEVPLSELLRVTTVDNFQGEEAKIIILSTVRSGGRPGFLAISNRVNVACSRARDGFYIVGNSETLRQVPMWSAIIGVFKDRIGFELVTRCDRHPLHCSVVHHPDDFASVGECPVMCGRQLPCGDICDQKCHPMELHDDDIMPCLQQCQKFLTCGHRCLRACSVDCGACLVSIGEKMLDCGHQVLISCSKEIASCTQFLGQRTLTCGHVVEIRCGDGSGAVIECKQRCLIDLGCGHTCTGVCGRCYTDGHSACSQECERLLPCGHYCRAACGHQSDCPSCDRLREFECEHGIRTQRCCAPSEPCLKMLDVRLRNGKTMRRLCCLPTAELPPHNLSAYALSCGHLVFSLESESRIPSKSCRKCKGENQSTGLIHVLECGHVVEIEELDKQNFCNVYAIDGAGIPLGFDVI